MRRGERIDARGIAVVDAEIGLRRRRRDHQAAIGAGAIEKHLRVGRNVEIEQRLPVFRHERIEIDQRRDLLRNFVGDRGDHHAAIGMAEQHDDRTGPRSGSRSARR